MLFVLRGVRLDGGAFLDPAAVEAIVAPFLNRPAGTVEIEEIRQRLTLYCIERGYLNSGVVVPEQTVGDGVLVLRVVAGRITEVDVTGTRYFRPSYFADRLGLALDTPFDVHALEREQRILLQQPFVRRLNLDVQPGLAPGEAHLQANVTEDPPFGFSLQVANDQSPTVGGVRGQAGAVAGNILGVGDLLQVQYGRSAALNDGSVSYSVPVTPYDTQMSVRYDINSNAVVTTDVQDLNITSRYDSLRVAISQPVYRTPDRSIAISLAGEWRHARSYLLGEPFSFVAGAEDGRTNVTALRLAQDWIEQSADMVLAVRSTFSLGVAAFGATTAGGPASGQFFSWLGQGQYIHRLFSASEFVLRGNVQLSADPLFPIEQYALGGLGSVRGYREYLMASDNAVNATIEARLAVTQLRIPGLADGPDDGMLQVVPFFDYGTGWNTRQPAPPFGTIAGVGSGLRWLVGSGVLAEVYYGYALRKVNVGNTLEDKGIYFRIAAVF